MTTRWRRLSHASWQSGLAVAAIAAAVALPTVLLAVGGGVFDHELAALDEAGYEIVVAAPGEHGLTGAHLLAERVAALPGAAAASPVLSAAIDAFGTTGGALPVLAEGIEPAPFLATAGPQERALLPAQLSLGDPSDASHFANGSYSGPPTLDAMIASPIAAQLGLSEGGTIGLAAEPNRSASVAFRITGLLEPSAPSLTPTAGFGLLLPLSDLQLLEGLARSNGSTGGLVDAADTLEVALAGAAAADPSAVARLASEIQAIVPFYGVSTLSQQAAQAQSAEAVLTAFYLGLSAVGIAVGQIFLGIVLVRQVETERRAIGIRRAIGLSGRSIALLMLRRAALLAALGVAAGLVAGALLVGALAALGSGPPREAASLAVFDPLELGLLAFVLVALSLLASLAATRAALRLSIPEALR